MIKFEVVRFTSGGGTQKAWVIDPNGGDWIPASFDDLLTLGDVVVFDRPGHIVRATGYFPPARLIPEKCAKCGRPNDYGAEANRGNDFICGQCRADETL